MTLFLLKKNNMDKKIIISVIIAILILAAALMFVLPKHNSATSGKCGDGICDSFEKAHPALCPHDCENQPNTSSQSNTRYSFFEVHMDPSSANEEMFAQLKSLMNLTEDYGIKATLLFTPQWVEMIENDPAKINLINKWRQEGHEIGAHHHGLMGLTVNPPDSCVWDGYTNSNVSDSDLLKLKEDCVKSYPQLSGLWDKTMRIKDRSMSAFMNEESRLGEIKTLTTNVQDDYPAGPTCEGGGKTLASAGMPIAKIISNTHQITKLFPIVLLNRANSNGEYDSIGDIEAKFLSTSGPFGVNIHPEDYKADSDLTKQWFEFLKQQGTVPKTMSEICASAS